MPTVVLVVPCTLGRGHSLPHDYNGVDVSAPSGAPPCGHRLVVPFRSTTVLDVGFSDALRGIVARTGAKVRWRDTP